MSESSQDRDRYLRGREVFASQFGVEAEEAERLMGERIGARMAGEAMRSAADAWVEDELSLRDRSLVVLASLVSQGVPEEYLRNHMRWAVAHGSSRAELEAMLCLLAGYTGYPRVAAAMIVLRSELGEG